MIATRTLVFGFIVAAAACVMNIFAFSTNVVDIPASPVWGVLVATVLLFIAVWMFCVALGDWRQLMRERVATQMNVRIVRDDKVLRCRIVYAGLRDELHTWVIVEPPVFAGDGLLVDMIPPRTQIVGL